MWSPCCTSGDKERDARTNHANHAVVWCAVTATEMGLCTHKQDLTSAYNADGMHTDAPLMMLFSCLHTIKFASQMCWHTLGHSISL